MSEADPAPRASDADGDGRVETVEQRADRNWSELMQEFRVLQTGTQILAGFLLTLPFQARFAELSTFDHTLYLTLVLLAVVVTLLALTPVTLHRLLFQRRVKPGLVRLSNTLLLVCLAAASLLITGVVLFVFDFVAGPDIGLLTAVCVLVLMLLVWTVGPRIVRAVARRVSR